MRYNIANSVEQYSKKHSHNKLWIRVVSVLGSIVVFCTTYALILPAITLENEAYCGIEEHLHDDNCYRQITTETVLACEAIAPHAHTDECFNEYGVICCGYADFLIHTHNDDCYNALGELVCPLEEHDFHIHNENCLSEVSSSISDDEVLAEINEIDEIAEINEIEADTAEKVLICTLDENEGHIHTDDCLEYESVLICEIDEAESHIHDEACSVEVVDYSNLICTELETDAVTHEHTEECYAAVLDIDNPVCGLEEDAEHTHDDTCYGKIVDYDTLLCDIEPVEGHTHDDSCYGVCDEMLCTLEESEGHVHGDECYELIPTGNYICGMIEVSRLHVHNDALCYDEEGNLVCGMIEVYEHIHDYTCFAESEITDFKLTCGFAEDVSETEEIEEIGETVEKAENLEELHEHSKLCYGEWELICTTEEHAHSEECFVDPNPEATPGLYIFSDDNVYVEVQLPEDTTVPKDAQLVVTPLSDEDESYADYVTQAEEKFGGEIANIALYDISFYTAEGEYIPVGETANISMAFVECPVDKEADVEIIHFDNEEDEPILIDNFRIVEEQIEMFVEKAKKVSEDVIDEIQDISDAQELQSGFSIQSVVDAVVAFVKPDDVETTEIDANETVSEVRTVVEFTTDGFSVFAVVQIDFRKEYGTYILDAVNANDLDGKTFVISTSASITNNNANNTSSHRALTSDIVSFEPNEDRNLDNMHLAAGDVNNNGGIVTVKTSSIEKYLWKFENVKDNVYYIQSVATGEYLHIGQNGANAHTSPNVKFEITVTVDGNIVTLQGGGEDKDKRILAYDVNNARSIFTADNNQDNPGNSEKFVLSSLGVATNGLAVDANLNGVTAVISIRDAWNGNYYAISSDDKTYTDGDNSTVTTLNAEQVQRVENTNTVYITPGNNKLLWTFHLVGENTYTIESVEKKGQYLCRKGIGLEVRKDNPTQFTLDTGSGNGDLVLVNDNGNDKRYISIATDGPAFIAFREPTANNYQRADLLISQYGKTIVNFPWDGDIQPVVDLDNRYYMILAVDNDGVAGSVALTNGVDKVVNEEKIPSIITLPVGDATYKALDGQYVSDFDFVKNNKDFNTYYNLTWFFEADPENPGSYFIRAYNGQTGEWVGYLNAEGNSNEEAIGGYKRLFIDTEQQSFEVMKAMNTDNGDAVVLRRRQSEVYVYLYGNKCVNDEAQGATDNNYFIGRNAGKDTAGQSEKGNHVVLAGFQNVNKILEATEYLLDNLDVDKDGKFVFTDDAYIGSALPENSNGVPKNNNHGQQGNYGANHQPDFVVGYDQAQAYRREMQELARLIRSTVAGQTVTYDGINITLTADEIQYVKSAIDVIAQSKLATANYENVFGENGKLKWLWDVVKTVESNDPIGVKVNLFNYGSEGDPDMNSTASDISKALLDAGFSFYHKIQYDSYTAIVDSSRNNTQNMGCNDSALTMYPTLYNGSPSVSGGKGTTETISQADGSLGYLFDDNSKYKVATMDMGGGLFQRDNDGYYYYYCNENAAYYDKNENRFVLYDTVVRPMYIHGYMPGAINDVYNFLPFNDPYDGLIFDDPNTILSNRNGVIETRTMTVNDNTFTKTYTGDADNEANIDRSGYINERADMWFGMTIEFDFYMTADGRVTYGEGDNAETQDMVFEFYGDDDVWVYIDDQLVLDIGGVHGAEKGTINFATGAVFYQDGGTKADGRGDVEKYLSDIEGLETDKVTNTLKPNSKHTLKFFYMERGGNVSYCGLRFNMPTLLPESLTVSKELDYDNKEGEDNNPVADYVANSLEYQFRVVTAEKVDNDGKTEYKPTGKLFIKAGEPYDILDKKGSVVEKGTVGENGIFTLKAGQSAVFSNIPTLGADAEIDHYFVQELVSGELTGQYQGVTYVVDSTSPGTIKNENTEKIENFYGYTSGEIEIKDSHTVTFKNILNTSRSTLEIEKAEKEGSTFDKGQTFKFQVEFGDQLLPVDTEYTIKETGKEDVGAKSLADGIIELKIGQTAVFDNLIAGMKYEVMEVIGADEKDEFSVIYSGDPTYGVIGVGGKVHITATNYTGSTSVDIPIEKKVQGGSVNDIFTFSVEQGTYDAENKVWNPTTARGYLQDVTVNVVDGVSGKGELSILYGSAGTYYYRITEKAKDGYVNDKTVYIVEVTVEESTFEDGNKKLNAKVTKIWKDGKVLTNEEGQDITDYSNISLSFTNTLLIPITIDKNVIGTSTDEEFEFTVKIGEDEPQRITLKPGESETIMVPWGAKVEVVETSTGNYIPYYTFAKADSGTKYEAEDSELIGAGKVKGESVTASGGVTGEIYVGNIGGSNNNTCTFDVKVQTAGHYLVYFRYGTWDQRSFGVTVNGGTQQELKCPATGGWHKYTLSTPIVVELKASELNTIVVGGVNNGESISDTPNLDYILVVPITKGSTAKVGSEAGVKEPTNISFVNQVTYTLPETGGVGTYRYTFGGVALILGATFLMYKSKKCKKKGDV